MKPEQQKIIEKMLKQGYSKQNIYETLKNNNDQKKKLAKSVQATVSPKSKKRFMFLNLILLFSFIISILLTFILVGFESILIMDIAFIVIVLRFQVKYYVWIALKAAMPFIFLILIITEPGAVPQDRIPFNLVLSITAIISLIIGLYINKKLNPALSVKQIEIKNEFGELIKKHVYDFVE